MSYAIPKLITCIEHTFKICGWNPGAKMIGPRLLVIRLGQPTKNRRFGLIHACIPAFAGQGARIRLCKLSCKKGSSIKFFPCRLVIPKVEEQASFMTLSCSTAPVAYVLGLLPVSKKAEYLAMPQPIPLELCQTKNSSIGKKATIWVQTFECNVQ